MSGVALETQAIVLERTKSDHVLGSKTWHRPQQAVFKSNIDFAAKSLIRTNRRFNNNPSWRLWE
jgi:hypothetical protein